MALVAQETPEGHLEGHPPPLSSRCWIVSGVAAVTADQDRVQDGHSGDERGGDTRPCDEGRKYRWWCGSSAGVFARMRAPPMGAGLTAGAATVMATIPTSARKAMVTMRKVRRPARQVH